MAEKQVRVAVLMDDASFVTGSARVSAATAGLGDSVVGTNTKIATSQEDLAAITKKTSDAQVAALLKVREASKLRAANLSSTIAAGAGAAPGTRAAEEASAATVLLERENAKLARSYGYTSAATRQFAGSSKEAEGELNKLVRGGLAGSGALSSLGRSLAFSSSGFIAFAVGAELVTKSITSAEDLEKAQASLGVAIQHTGGSLAKLTPQYKATAEAAAQFGIDQATATTGLARATVLTGDAAASQRAYQEALVISKATGKDFNSVLIATSKGQEGITTSLRRYGILVDATTPGQEQFNQVMKRFGGQAEANTTSLERLHAQFTNALQTIGLELLPTVNRLADGFANWLEQMNKSGKLQKDVASGMHTISVAISPLVDAMHGLADAIGLVNSGWSDLKKLQGKGGITGFLAGSVPGGVNVVKQGLENLTPVHAISSLIDSVRGHAPPPVHLVPPSRFIPASLTAASAAGGTGPFGSAQPLKQFWKTFALSYREQLAQVRASMTKTTRDDVAEARQEIARIKSLINQGRLHGPALLAALQLEASAVNTIESAEAAAIQKRAAAAQKRAAAAQAAKAKIQAAIEASINPINLQVRLARDEATNNKADLLKTLKKMRAAARKAIASGKLSQQQLIEAYNQITQLNQQIADATKKQNQAANRAGRAAFKQLNLDKLTGGLDLTPAQRKALRARLSQVGPGGTVPGDGTGAYGYSISASGRPIHVHTRIDIDGHKVAENTTKHQQRRHRRNSSQRRGPQAGG